MHGYYKKMQTLQNCMKQKGKFSLPSFLISFPNREIIIDGYIYVFFLTLIYALQKKISMSIFTVHVYSLFYKSDVLLCNSACFLPFNNLSRAYFPVSNTDLPHPFERCPSRPDVQATWLTAEVHFMASFRFLGVLDFSSKKGILEAVVPDSALKTRLSYCLNGDKLLQRLT